MMLVLQTHQLSKSYGVTSVLQHITIQIREKERIGLVGVNGAGKSTLLKMITGDILPDEGQVQWAKHATFGYLAQDSGLESQHSIWEEMKSVYTPILQMEKTLRQLEVRMGENEVIQDEDLYAKITAEYASLSALFEEKGGYQYEANIRSVLHGLGFNTFPSETPIHTLSGGQKTRLALGRLLLVKPDLLILDEPTNYLDIDTLSWLEGWLQGYPGALLIVSHDRHFLDALATTMIEIDRHKAKTYPGNYSKYAALKKQQTEQQLQQYNEQQDEIERLKDFVQKNIVRASTTKRAQSRRKQLDKIERIDRPTDNNRTHFSFDIERQTGVDVVDIQNLSIRFDSNNIFQNVNFGVKRGERIALVGPNGVGKSTLLKILTDQLRPDTGHVRYGTHVAIGYYDQEQTGLNPSQELIDELWNHYPHKTETEIRTVLGNFLFEGDDVYKNIEDLSGGEKARVSLAKLMLKNANLLILDEPTNHLDIGSKEVLEDALIDYPGTIIFVSHDRYFLNKMSTRTIELSPNGVKSYLGNYKYMLEKKQEIEETTIKTSPSIAPSSSTKNQFQEDKEALRKERSRQRQIEQIEQEISLKEEEIAKLEASLCEPEVFQDHVKTLQIQTELDQKKQQLDQLLDQWSTLQEE